MNTNLIGIGLYTSLEAAALIKSSSININRWLKGYNYRNRKEENIWVEPLWEPDLERGYHDQVQLTFRDLMELRFVDAFRKAGLSMQKIRALYTQAENLIDDYRPLSSAKFRTDGNTIFYEGSKSFNDENELIDLRNYQSVFKRFIEPTFKDIEYEQGAPIIWKPWKNDGDIVLDPERCFGQPILNEYSIPTKTLFSAYLSEDEDAKRVAKIYEIPTKHVNKAIKFETYIANI